MKIGMKNMKIRPDERYIVFQSLLKGPAYLEHQRHVFQLRTDAQRDGESDDEGWQVECDEYAARLIGVYDAGLFGSLLKRLAWIKQLQSEDFMQFEARFCEVVDGLQRFGKTLTDEEVMELHKDKMPMWTNVAPFKPRTLADVRGACIELGIYNSSELKPMRSVVMPVVVNVAT